MAHRRMMAARFRISMAESRSRPTPGVYDNMKKARGRVLHTFRLMAHHARSVARSSRGTGRWREGALDLKLRQLAYVKASQINGCKLLSDATTRPSGRGTEWPKEKIRCAGRLHDQPALLRSPSDWSSAMRRNDREGPGRFAAREEPRSSWTRKPSCSSRSASRQPTSRTASTRRSHGTGDVTQRRR